MLGAFDLVEQLGDVVQADTWPQLTEVTRHHPERLGVGALRSGQKATPDCIVDDLSKGPAGTARFISELGRHVLVQS